MLRFATCIFLTLFACGTPSVVNEQTPTCTVSAWPTSPKLEVPAGITCPNSLTCFYTQDTLALGVWIRDVERIHQDLKHCKIVTWNKP